MFLAVTSKFYWVVLYYVRKNLEHEELKGVALVLELRLIKQEQRDMSAERDVLHRSSILVVKNESKGMSKKSPVK